VLIVLAGEKYEAKRKPRACLIMWGELAEMFKLTDEDGRGIRMGEFGVALAFGG
jgi:hypothetical protein